MSVELNIQNKLKEIFQNLFFVNPEDVNDKTSPEDIEQWDSLQHLNLVLSIEEEFGLSITPEESNEMLNFGLAAMLIDEKLK
ncbi:MAG: acyl carrier protein [Candidatus Zapsychrus exili]|nr:acyl carrier protein [Candidatus Zapsychrus exili]